MHQPASSTGGLVPYRGSGSQSHLPPLLPYERDLISLIGCTEEEYRAFNEEVRRRGYVRPAEYDHIPDVRCDPVTVAVSLIVGAALTVVGNLLVPKPKPASLPQQRSNNRGENNSQTINLDSASGRTRFNDTEGFGGTAPLTKYNTPVAIPFGRWQLASVDYYPEASGGLLITPSLVWARLFSYGTYQAYKGLYVVGEYGLTPPDVQGVYVGNNALGNVFKNSFAVYWSGSQGSNRIQGSDLIAGTRGNPAAGDPEAGDEVFTCPTRLGSRDLGFCSSFTPSNSVEFGVYDPIYNGTQIKVNLTLVQVAINMNPQSIDRAVRERAKIIGTDVSGPRAGMPGEGRLYSCRMGLVAHNGNSYSLPTNVNIQVGDKVTFRVVDRSFQDLGDVRLEDMNQRAAALIEAADDALQLGESFIIGRMMFQVTNRRTGAWNRGDGDRDYELTCIDGTGGSPQIRIAGTGALEEPIAFEGTTYRPWYSGISAFPLLRASLATVRNQRKVDVTEIGIRSVVYQQLNGLCNFPSMPSPPELVSFYERDIQVNNGFQTRYINRTSVWSLQIRPASADFENVFYEWVSLGVVFAVTNNTPAPVFNFIRIRSGTPMQMEYRIVPRSGASSVAFSSGNDRWWELSGSGTPLATDVSTPYGTFHISAQGTLRNPVDELFISPELARGVTLARPEITTTTVATVEVVEQLPAGITGRLQNYYTAVLGGAGSDENRGLTKEEIVPLTFGDKSISLVVYNTSIFQTGSTINQVSAVSVIEQLPPGGTGRVQNYYTAILGGAGSGGNAGRTVEKVVNLNIDGRTIALLVFNTSIFEPTNPLADNGYIWNPTYQFGVQSSSPDWFVNLTFEHLPVADGGVVLRVDALRTETTQGAWIWSPTYQFRVETSSTNWAVGDQFEHVPSSLGGVRLRVSSLDTEILPAVGASAGQFYESKTQVADVSHYDEIQKSNSSSPEHRIAYVNESLAETPTVPQYKDLTMMGVALRSGNNFAQISEISAWVPNGVSARRFASGDSYGPSNKFNELVYYLLTDKNAGLGNVIDPKMIDEAGFARTSYFLQQNRIFFNGVLAERVNLRSYLSDIAPQNLCNFVVKNGRFSVEPALPADANGSLITGPLSPVAIYTSGNIIDGTFAVEALERQERLQIRMAVTWRNSSNRNRLPSNESFLVSWADEASNQPVTEENLDMSSFCTTKHHAFMTARYLMSIRRRVTHGVKFKTTTDEANVAPGSLIKVVTQSIPYSVYNNGIVLSDGTVQSLTPVQDGTYSVNLYRTGSDLVESATLVVSDGKVADSSMYGSLFAIENLSVGDGLYQIEEVGLDEDGLVEITASHHPTDSSGASILIKDVLTESLFSILD